jgi:hypothetical protein
MCFPYSEELLTQRRRERKGREDEWKKDHWCRAAAFRFRPLEPRKNVSREDAKNAKEDKKNRRIEK